MSDRTKESNFSMFWGVFFFFIVWFSVLEN